ncbi:MAG: VTT domain-containing protein [Pseudomonadota bacterium]
MNHNFIVVGIVVLLWSFFLFLTVLPLGTVTVVAAGYILGPIAGAIQFVSLVAASILLYELAKEKDNRVLDDRLVEYPRLLKLINTMRHRGIVFVVLSRLLPMIPSAIASLSASYVGISRQDYLLGLFLAGWVRPILFGMLGALGRSAPICPGFSGI